MATVHCAHGQGEIVKTETVRGRTQHLVKGRGFKAWCNAEDVRTASDGNLFSVQFEPGMGRKHKGLDPELLAGNDHMDYVAATTVEPATHVNEDNSTTLPYNPSPQYPTEMFSQDANIQPGENEIDADKRTSPADSRTLKKGPKGQWPGPDPKLFAKSAGGAGFAQHHGGIQPEDVDPEYLEQGHPISHNLDEEGGAHYLGGIRHWLDGPSDAPDVPADYWYKHPEGYPHGPEGHPATHEHPRANDWPVANLSNKYIHLGALEDPTSPVGRWRRDPIQFLYARAYALADAADGPGLAEYGRLVEADAMLREGAWTDVRNKALRLRREGAVTVYDVSPNGIYARVEGDHGTYDTMIVKSAGLGGSSGQSISDWHCDCEWGRWAFKRKLTYVGRLCSHGYAAYLEMESDKHKGNPGRFQRSAGVVEDFKKYVKDSNEGHVDHGAADNFISLAMEPLSDVDVDTLYSYVDDHHTEKEDRDYKTASDEIDPNWGPPGSNSTDSLYPFTSAGGSVEGPADFTQHAWELGASLKSADVLRTTPHSLTPDMVFVPGPDDSEFVDVTKDERKTTGPDQITKKSKIDSNWVDHAQVKYDDHEPIARFSHVDAMGNGYTPASLWRFADGGVFGDIPAVPPGDPGKPIESGPPGDFLPVEGPRGGTSPVPTGQELARGNSPTGGAGSGNPLSDFAPTAPGLLTGHEGRVIRADEYDPNDTRDKRGILPSVSPPGGSRPSEDMQPASPGLGPTGGHPGGTGPPAPGPIAPPAAPAGASPDQPAGVGTTPAPTGTVNQSAGTSTLGGGGGWTPNADTSAIGPGDYKINQGDTLSGIAERAGMGGDYQSLADSNKIADPNVINAGDTINIPGAPPVGGPEAAPPDVGGLSDKTGGWHYADSYTHSDTNPGDLESPDKRKNPPTGSPAPAAPPAKSGLPQGMDPGLDSKNPPANPSGHGSVNTNAPVPMSSGSTTAYGPSAYDPMAEPGAAQTGTPGMGGGGGGGFDPSMISDIVSPIAGVAESVMGGLGGLGGILGSLTYVADNQLLDKLRNLSGQDPPLGNMDSHNDEVRGVVEELRDRGYDTDQLVAMVRHADDKRDADEGGAYGRPGGGDWADLPFAGSGPDPKLWYGTSEDYVDDNEKDNREDVTSGEGDATKYTKPGQGPRQKASVRRQGEQGNDIVRQFQASGGGALAEESSGGNYSDAVIAERAQHFLKTAGRHFSLADQRELEAEFHPLGARNLPTEEDLAGTHYLD